MCAKEKRKCQQPLPCRVPLPRSQDPPPPKHHQLLSLRAWRLTWGGQRAALSLCEAGSGQGPGTHMRGKEDSPSTRAAMPAHSREVPLLESKLRLTLQYS